jgi:lysozyme
VITTLKEQLQRDEGYRLTAYKCSEGKWTIGIGHLLGNAKDWTGYTISQAEADALFKKDIATALLDCSTLLHPSEPVRSAVLHNMCFNIGITRLLGFKKFLAAFKARDWHTASAEMLNSKWATQVGKRAQRLSTQMLTGEWQ